MQEQRCSAGCSATPLQGLIVCKTAMYQYIILHTRTYRLDGATPRGRSLYLVTPSSSPCSVRILRKEAKEAKEGETEEQVEDGGKDSMDEAWVLRFFNRQCIKSLNAICWLQTRQTRQKSCSNCSIYRFVCSILL